MDVFATAINISARFFQRATLTGDEQIQLVGAGSLHLASKLRETVPMKMADVLYYTDDAYTLRDLEVRCLYDFFFFLKHTPFSTSLVRVGPRGRRKGRGKKNQQNQHQSGLGGGMVLRSRSRLPVGVFFFFCREITPRHPIGLDFFSLRDIFR